MKADMKFRRLSRDMQRAQVNTDCPFRGQHLVQHRKGVHPRAERVVLMKRNKVRQVAYMPAPPAGFIYIRDASKPGRVPMLAKRPHH